MIFLFLFFTHRCDAKEKELSLQRKSLYDSRRLLQQEQERLLEGQTLLNQREDYIFQKSKELSRFEKELGEAKSKFEEECKLHQEKKSNLDLDMSALATREEVCIFICFLLFKKLLKSPSDSSDRDCSHIIILIFCVKLFALSLSHAYNKIFFKVTPWLTYLSC